jgi:uncharacterized repeat protein (TIGR03803 family)
MKPDSQTSRFLRLAALLLALGCSPLAWSAARYKVLHNFDLEKDGPPFGPLLLDGSGNLYGNTTVTTFELTSRAGGRWSEKTLHQFSLQEGMAWGALISDTWGNLYGTTQGAVKDSGVFELSPSPTGWDFSPIYTDGAGPGVAIDGLGNLYGEIGPGDYYGAGAIGELSPGSDGWNYTQLYSFCSGNSCPDGVDPPAPPIWDGKGNLFDTTTEGGIYQGCWMYTEGCGVIYEMTPSGDGTWTYYVLHRFLEHSSKDGQSPYSGLVMDKAGSFYGATWVGGQYNHGTVFKLAYTGGKWKETILYDFPNCAYGCMVEGTLALDKSGNLYGTAAGGTGNCGYACGVVFKLSPQKDDKWKYSVVFDLTPETGGVQPYYGVIVDDKGHLFGVTSSFGKYGGGTAFEIIP